VELTHALENAFDGIRKQTHPITTPLIDLCLESIDILRALRDEVAHGVATQPVDVTGMVARFTALIPADTQPGVLPIVQPSGSKSIPANVTLEVHTAQSEIKPTQEQNLSNPAGESILDVRAGISPASIASAARAFQLMLVLQECGQILSMQPSQAEIESAAPVFHFSASLLSMKPAEEVRRELERISEIERVVVEAAVENPVFRQAENLEADTPALEEPPLLGEFLVKKGVITQSQLDAALQEQKTSPSTPPPLFGQILVQTGAVTQERLDRMIAELILAQKTALHSAKIADQERSSKERLAADKTVRTSVERLDSLMNLVGELITDRNRLFELRMGLETLYHADERLGALADTILHVGRLTDQLQEEVMHIRMLPIANVFNKFPRMVRDLAQKTGKDIALVIHGQETELDRSVIEEINDPLIHILRNAVDHGIESSEIRASLGKPPRGTVTLSARHEQGHIVITVEDDGKGIDAVRLKASAVKKGLISEAEAALLTDEQATDLIFLSGLSTSDKVTDISGRGVGMDIVRNNIERLNGSIIVETHPGRGTTFKVLLPLTLAIVPTLLVRVGMITFAIPLVLVSETLRLGRGDIQTVRGKPVTLLRDQILTLVNMAEIYALPDGTSNKGFSFVVVVSSSKTQVGLVVDELVGEQDVVVKSFGELVGDVPGLSSAAILGDGQVALIIDLPGLYKLAGLH
ncbi:MAG: chemotaxis protein CheA, partial [Chloroflexi bacterium]|nr:chemotaxis protein CheA [Chloroflexota bacterium]